MEHYGRQLILQSPAASDVKEREHYPVTRNAGANEHSQRADMNVMPEL
jgi:hypothetical protein